MYRFKICGNKNWVQTSSPWTFSMSPFHFPTLSSERKAFQYNIFVSLPWRSTGGERPDLVRKHSNKRKQRRERTIKKATCCFGSSYLSVQDSKGSAHILKQHEVAVLYLTKGREVFFLLRRALVESTVRHQAGQYEIITTHNGHETSVSFTLRDSLHAFVC